MTVASINNHEDEPTIFEQAAAWMHETLIEKHYLDQGVAATSIRKIFGEDVTYQNENGNLAISKNVLKVFKKLTGDDFIWDRSDRAWKARKPYHKAGRQQD